MDHEQAAALLTEELAASLVAEQFPPWAHLPVSLVVPGGHDNRTFRLGEELSIRLPTDDGYVPGELKEHAWLGRLAPQLPLPIPEVVGVGRPSERFPRPWSVRRWIPGETTTWDRLDDPVRFARDLAAFLRALRAADAAGGPAAGAQSFFCGADPAAYDAETRASIEQLRDELDVASVTEVWDRALASRWGGPPVWFHGDVAHGNLLLREGRLAAVIDFGTSGVGDPACDLMIAFTLLSAETRATFRAALGVDEATWTRGRGWALATGLNAYVTYAAVNPRVAAQTTRQITEALAG